MRLSLCFRSLVLSLNTTSSLCSHAHNKDVGKSNHRPSVNSASRGTLHPLGSLVAASISQLNDEVHLVGGIETHIVGLEALIAKPFRLNLLAVQQQTCCAPNLRCKKT